MIIKSCILSIQNIKILLILIAFFAFSCVGKAQQFNPNTEVGVLLGASYYLGDLNTTHFKNALACGGLVIRRNIDRRFSYKAELLYLNIAADDKNNPTDTIAIDRGLHFKSPVYELSGQIEFNFLPYEPGNALYTWTPFVYAGVSLFHFNPQAENPANGEWVDLQPLGTEGQGTAEYNLKEYSLTQVAIPMGGGIKIAVNPSFSIILEYGIRKTFTDYLDDVSTTFVGGNGDPYPVEMSQDAINMSDPRAVLDPLLAHSKGYHRGDPNKNDWYSFAGITLSFKLNNNTKDCNY
jgi:hypothetical protein